MKGSSAEIIVKYLSKRALSMCLASPGVISYRFMTHFTRAAPSSDPDKA